MSANNAIRKEKYRRLKNCGFTSEEANRYKDRTIELVNKLCDIKVNDSKYTLERIIKALDKEAK